MTTKPPAAKRPAAGAPGVNGLITAVAVAATLGGWAVLSLTQPEAAAGGTTLDAAPAEAAAQEGTAQPGAGNVPQLRRVTAPAIVVTRSSR